MHEAVIESHDIFSADRQGMTSILWENTAKLFDATSIAGSLNAHLDSFCDGHFSFKRSSKSKRISCKAGSQERYQPPPKPPQTPPKKQQCKNQECLASDKKKLIACARVRCKRRVDSVAASPREYLVRRAAKNVISPPKTPPKKQQCKNQECLASYKKKLIACARVRCKRRVDSVAASPREYLVRRAAKNVISPPKTPPKKQQCKNQECLASYKKKLIACARVRCKRRVDSVAASPREYLVRRAAKNAISPPQNPPNPPQETTMQKSRVSCKLQEEVDSVCQGTVQEKSG